MATRQYLRKDDSDPLAEEDPHRISHHTCHSILCSCVLYCKCSTGHQQLSISILGQLDTTLFDGTITMPEIRNPNREHNGEERGGDLEGAFRARSTDLVWRLRDIPLSSYPSVVCSPASSMLCGVIASSLKWVFGIILDVSIISTTSGAGNHFHYPSPVSRCGYVRRVQSRCHAHPNSLRYSLLMMVPCSNTEI